MTAATIESLRFPLRLFIVNAPPMEMSARGSATAVERLKALSRNAGKRLIKRAYSRPVRHPIISGLVTISRRVIRMRSLKTIRSPEYQINVDTASTLMKGITNPIRMLKCLTPSSPRALYTMAMPM